jgi:exodeoxyribonuclease VII large subunit
MTVTMAAQGQRILGSAHMLQAHDPQRVLRRGYAWIEAVSEGEDAVVRPVVSVHQLQSGQQVRAVWSDGRATATINTLETLPPAP